MNPQEQALSATIAEAIAKAGGWLPFDRFMAMALYAPGLGYYTGPRRKFGTLPQSGSDFVTAPEMSPLFGAALAVQVGHALDATGTDEVWEFGAGSGALAAQLLAELGERIRRYVIVDLSGSLRSRQAEKLAPWRARVEWLDRLPERIEGVVVGNEVLDAMPVQLHAFDGTRWRERGVIATPDGFAFEDRDNAASQAIEALMPAAVPGTVTETHAQAEAFIRTLAGTLAKGAAFFIDYGFPEAEYYHPQRHGGTLMCHHLHQADPDPLVLVGEKDITAHVNFTGIALAGQDAGLHVLGYTNQGHFLLNCGIAERLQHADIAERAMAAKLINEHEMGELFKVIGFAAHAEFDAIGFAHGDRSHTL